MVEAPRQVSDRDSFPPPTLAGQTSSMVAAATAATAATTAPRDARRVSRTPPRPAKRKRVDKANASDSAAASIFGAILFPHQLVSQLTTWRV